MIDEKELVIKFGMVNFGDDVNSMEQSARSSFGYIMHDVNELASRYIKLGFHMDEFNRFEYYKVFGFSTFKEFCEENMPLSYSTCMRCIQVFREFSQKGVNGGNKMFIDEKYKDFSFTQLSEMVSLDSRRREIIQPDWSVEKIRRYKKGLRKQDREKDAPDRVEDEPTPEEIFSQVLQQPDVMKMLAKALENRYGENCMQNFESTAKTATFECGGEKYRLQLNKVK